MRSRLKPANARAQQLRQDWQPLKTLTQARIGLGRCGASIPTDAQLKFSLDHALARDAVNIPLDVDALNTSLNTLGLTVLRLHSRASHRTEYLQRPDLGRRLNESALRRLESDSANGFDIALVLADGLSSTAVQHHGADLANKIAKSMTALSLSISPVCVVEQGRVAIGDEIGQHLRAQAVIVIVGERPGLSAPDSLGIYYTYGPKVGLDDASRNCISNIRPLGMSLEMAQEKITWLVEQSFQKQFSGVALKDNAMLYEDELSNQKLCNYNFLLPNHKP